jgi:hypothetical protein
MYEASEEKKKFNSEPREQAQSLMQQRLKKNLNESRRFQTRNNDINKALTLIERNSRAKEMLNQAIELLRRQKVDQGADRSSQY